MKLQDITLSIPHASTHIPTDIRKLMKRSDEELRQEPDLYTDQIYKIDGPTIVEAQVNRVISDVNRAPDEIYTQGRLRSQGVIMLNQSHGNNVFFEDPDLETIGKWIQEFHEPYHRKLQAAIQKSRFVIDCHSMWSVTPNGKVNAGQPRPDIALGNRFYTCCDAETTQFFRSYFEQLGYDVLINNPFSGRYIIGTHCSRIRTPGIQIELNRALYMNEETLEPDMKAIACLNEQFTDCIMQFSAWFGKNVEESQITDLST